jgi:hypothetical protein
VKIRNGFVSNSSSSSFVVNLDKLSAAELKRLIKYQDVDGVPSDGYRDHWTITVDEDKGVVQGWTNMDNGDLDEYMKTQHIDDSSFVYNSY